MDTHLDFDADIYPLYGSPGSLRSASGAASARRCAPSFIEGAEPAAPSGRRLLARCPSGATRRVCAGIAARNCYGRAGFGVGYGGPAFS